MRPPGRRCDAFLVAAVPKETWMGRPTLEGTGTRLGRAVRATVATTTAVGRHREEHPRTNWLRDVILGGQDGLVNILGIILG
jgi:hypothetical protein